MKEKFKNLQIIFLGLLLGQLTFAIVANFIITSGAIADTGMLIYLVPAVMIVGIIIGFYIFNASLTKSAEKEGTIETQFSKYRKSSMVRWAMMEIGNLLAIIAAIIEANTFYFVLFSFGLLIFATTRPSVQDFSKRFGLSSGAEKELI